jgi:hypothetical protein
MHSLPEIASRKTLALVFSASLSDCGLAILGRGLQPFLILFTVARGANKA